MKITTANGTRAELRDGYLYLADKLDGAKTGMGLTCSIDELEDAIEELAALEISGALSEKLTG